MDFNQFIQTVYARLQAAAKGEAQSFGFTLQAYARENMHTETRPGIRKVATRGRGISMVGRGQKNTTDKLYTNTGRLARSLIRNQAGNIQKAVIGNDRIEYVYGIDLNTVPYARVHEYGGYAGRGLRAYMRPRPYLQPAVKKFEQEQLMPMLERIAKAAFGA